ncbi:hypothetical protein Pen02_62700 [Plantactinospora endophytica]|uniref:Uncharacterized protein n=1 Tax=Plantactinospora endophytica TaxID=673535 RepID=A0ABQ4E9G6_9ACTN|nr:hypothetical protein Pen02_62700 [Plantactinospora endophytica]
MVRRVPRLPLRWLTRRGLLGFGRLVLRAWAEIRRPGCVQHDTGRAGSTTLLSEGSGKPVPEADLEPPADAARPGSAVARLPPHDDWTTIR